MLPQLVSIQSRLVLFTGVHLHAPHMRTYIYMCVHVYTCYILLILHICVFVYMYICVCDICDILLNALSYIISEMFTVFSFQDIVLELEFQGIKKSVTMLQVIFH